MPEFVYFGQDPRAKRMRKFLYTRPWRTNSKNDATEIPSSSRICKCPHSPVRSHSSQSESSQKSSIPTHGEDLSSSLNQRSSTSSEVADRNIRNPLSGQSHVSPVFTNHGNSSHREHVVSRNIRSETGESNSNSQRESRNDSSETITNAHVNNNSINSNSNRSTETSTTNGCNSPDFQILPPESFPRECGNPGYKRVYRTVESSEQRARYKANFNAEYEEYLRLHAHLKSISKKFAILEHRSQMLERGSEEHKKIRAIIYKEYRTYQQDRRYLYALKKFNFLHCKLSHIKKLVTEYDNAVSPTQ